MNPSAAGALTPPANPRPPAFRFFFAFQSPRVLRSCGAIVLARAARKWHSGGMKRFFVFLAAAAAALSAFAGGGQVRRLDVESGAMGRDIPNIVVLPEGCETSGREYPALYLLHGAGANFRAWLDIRPDLPELATRHGVIFVLPDGENSWYVDSPAKAESRFQEYLTNELPGIVDRIFPTRKSPKGRAVAGLSMGGHGAMWLAMNRPDVFGAAGSMSGALDITAIPKSGKKAEIFGPIDENPGLWDSFSILKNAERLAASGVAVSADCGTDDSFIGMNRAFHLRLLKLGVPHDYSERPGGHDNAYWARALPFQLEFFSGFFSSETSR